MSNSECKIKPKHCNGKLSLALAGECSNFKCQNKKKLYFDAIERCKNGNCEQIERVVGNNNKEIIIYARNSMTSIEEKQIIAQAFKKTGHTKFALEISRDISSSINLSDTNSIAILENSLRFQGDILKSMNKINESKFNISTANHIGELAKKARF